MAGVGSIHIVRAQRPLVDSWSLKLASLAAKSTVQQQETVVKMQLRLVDKSNWGAETSLQNLYPQQANYQSEYAQLWGAAA